MKRKRYQPAVEALEDRTLPSLDFGLAFGLAGPSAGEGEAIMSDAGGNSYVIGSFRGSMDADPGPGTYTLSAGDAASLYYQYFVAKYSATGTLVWALGMNAESLQGDTADLALDANGNVFITGNFRGTTSFGSITLTSQRQDGDVFIAKLDPAGNFVWATQLAGGNLNYVDVGDYGAGLAVDGSGNVYTTGWMFLSTLIFVSKHDSSGNLVWLKQVGNSWKSNQAHDIALDPAGNICVSGVYRGTIDFDPGAGTYNLNSVKNQGIPSMDAFVLKLDSNGNFVWAGSMGGKDVDAAQAIAVDGSGNVHVAGTFWSGTGNDFDPGTGKLSLPNAGSNDIFVVKLDANRKLLWARSMGGSGTTEFASGLAVDAVGNVFTTGAFSATADFDPGQKTFKLTSAGNSDVFVSQLSSAGNFVSAGRMGGPNGDVAYNLALDGAGNVYTTGRFTGTADFDPGPSEYLLTSASDSNGNPTSVVFVSKLVPSAGLQAARGAATSALPSRPLTNQQTDTLLAEALARWQAAGAETSRLGDMEVRIVDLPGALLGQASGHTIWLDDNAAGWGRFVDPTPWDDSEFTTPGDQGEQHRMDLLTTLAHEIGHLLGQEHATDGVMIDTLDTGTRRMPASGQFIDWISALDLAFSEPARTKRKW